MANASWVRVPSLVYSKVATGVPPRGATGNYMCRDSLTFSPNVINYGGVYGLNSNEDAMSEWLRSVT